MKFIKHFSWCKFFKIILFGFFYNKIKLEPRNQEAQPSWRVLAGNTIRDRGEVFDAQPFRHPRFEIMSGDNEFDVGLLRTSRPMTGLNMRPIVISNICADNCCNACGSESTTMIGWGNLINLHQISLNVVNIDECRRAFPTWFHIDDHRLCEWFLTEELNFKEF